MSKYAELYQLAKEEYRQSEVRFDTIDGKAINYLSALTLLVGASGYFVKWVVDNFIPPRSLPAWILTGLAALTAGALILAWGRVFSVLRVHKFKTFLLTDETLLFFQRNTEADIHFALARGFKDAWAENRAALELKAERLARGYDWIVRAMILLVLFSALYGTYIWASGGVRAAE